MDNVRSRALARKTGAGIWRRIYGDGFGSVCQGVRSVFSCYSVNVEIKGLTVVNYDDYDTLN